VRFDGPNPARLEHNAAWHDKMSFRELIKLAQQFTVQQMVERDMFQTRLKAGKPIGLHEFLYPLMQGYDSVAMDVDVEVGGSDQTFNMLAGRTLMKSLKGKEKFVVANRLLVDAASGKKLSKTEGSLVNLDDAPQDIFGRVMAMPDEMMPHVAELSTRMPMEKIQKLGKMKNPRDAKLILAEAVVSLYHSPAAAQKAREEWVRVFSKKETPEEIQELPSTPRGTAILEEIRISGVSSKSETMRLLRQGAIKINDSVEKNAERKTQDGDILKVGKKKYFRIRQK
jgi:tyrosyl-tRNA synthetase